MNRLFSSVRIQWLSLASLAVAFAVYATTDFSLGGASPLGLLLAAAGGWLLRLKEPIGGNLLLSFGGGALLLFPFLYEAPWGYTFLAVPVTLHGIKGLLAWWNEQEATSKK